MHHSQEASNFEKWARIALAESLHMKIAKTSHENRMTLLPRNIGTHVESDMCVVQASAWGGVRSDESRDGRSWVAYAGGGGGDGGGFGGGGDGGC